MRKIIIGLLLLLSFGASAQWQQTGSKVRYVNGLGIPTKDTAAGVSADSSQIVIRPADSSLYVKYKRTWLRVGGGAGGGSIGGTGTINTVAKFTASGFIGNSQIFDNGTNVRIGTTGGSPTQKLVVSFTQSTNSLDGVSINGTNSVSILSANAINPGGVWGLAGPYTGIFHYTNAPAYAFINDGGGYFVFNNSTTELMRITNGGNVGIGTTAPSSKFHIVGASRFVSTGGVTTPIINLMQSNDVNGYYLSIDNVLDGRMELRNDAGTTIQTWKRSSGNVGIGSYTLPAAKLVVDGTTLINTNTDNGVDILQVNGSILSTQYKLSSLNTAPASASATGTLGEIRIDANYIYICTATNTWKRIAIATW
jgi:hypothetical protein